jgi:hypothetical protein
MFIKCKQDKKNKTKTYSYFLGLDLSNDTHIDNILAVFQNVNKLRHLSTSAKHK